MLADFVWLSTTVVQFLPPGRDAEGQNGHIRLKHDQNDSPGFFDIFHVSVHAFMLKCSVITPSTFLPDNGSEKQAKTLTLEKVITSLEPVFISHGYI